MNASIWRQSSKTKFISIAGVLTLLTGGAFAYVVFFSNPPKPWVVKKQISRHLKKESRTSDFSVDFKFPSREEMKLKSDEEGDALNPDAATGIMTEKSFADLRGEYMDHQLALMKLQRELESEETDLERKKKQLQDQEKNLEAAKAKAKAKNKDGLIENVEKMREVVASMEQALSAKKEKIADTKNAMAPILDDLKDIQSNWATELEAADRPTDDEFEIAQDQLLDSIDDQLNQAPTYATIYQLIGQELCVADQLFESKNPKHLRAALDITRKARRDAMEFAVDAWLAARICEAYIRPNLDVAESYNRRARISYEGLADECARAFMEAEERENVFTHYEWLISQASTPRREDWGRVKLSETYMREGDFKQAIVYLKKVKLTNDFAWALRRVGWLEQRAKNQN